MRCRYQWFCHFQKIADYPCTGEPGKKYWGRLKNSGNEAGNTSPCLSLTRGGVCVVVGGGGVCEVVVVGAVVVIQVCLESKKKHTYTALIQTLSWYFCQLICPHVLRFSGDMFRCVTLPYNIIEPFPVAKSAVFVRLVRWLTRKAQYLSWQKTTKHGTEFLAFLDRKWRCVWAFTARHDIVTSEYCRANMSTLLPRLYKNINVISK